jgi:hypothetical protein
VPENCALLKEKVSDLFSDFTKAEQEHLLKLLLHMKEALIERHILELQETHAKPAKADRR